MLKTFLSCLAACCIANIFAVPQVPRFTALPESKITVSETFIGKTPNQLIDGGMSSGDHCRFAPLKGAKIEVQFNRPTRIDNLALVRSGWKGWAIPEKVSIQIDEQPPFSVTLQSPQVLPEGVPPLEFDRIPVNAEVKKFSITVEETSGHSQNGTLELGQASTSSKIDFHQENVPENAAGIELTIRSAKQTATAEAVSSVDFHRYQSKYRVMLEPLSEGESIRKVYFEQMIDSDAPHIAFNPLRAFQLELQDRDPGNQLQIVSYRWITDGRGSVPAWKSLPALSFAPLPDGWRPGIPSEGFGRFGWLKDNGLLVGKLTNGNTFSYDAISNTGPTGYSFRFSCGPYNTLVWDRMNVQWSGVVHEQFYGDSPFSVMEPPPMAPELDQRKRAPYQLIYSSMIPGFMIDSSDRFFWMKFEKLSGDPAVAFYDTDQKLQYLPVKGKLPLQSLGTGWLLLFPDPQKLPLLLVFENHPESISITKEDILINYPEKIGKLAIGTPAGYRAPDKMPIPGSTLFAQWLDISRQLAAMLRAYPLTCQMFFKDAGELITVRETFGRIIWRNAWNEQSLPISPVSPVLSFAKANGYPIAFSPTLKNSGILTKYGPYEYDPGFESIYTLPMPPSGHTTYLAPKEPTELSKYVAANLIPPIDADYMLKSGMKIWWKWSSSSFAAACMTPEQKQVFLTKWKQVAEENLRPHTWMLRREPHSGALYMYGFAWKRLDSGTLGDVNSGCGAALYGPYTYALTSGDWDLVRSHWPIMQGAFRYFLMAHDWCQMQTAAQEESGSSDIDMEGIGYEGAVAYMNMAKILKLEDDYAIGKLMVARLAVPCAMRWRGSRLLNPETPENQIKYVTVGLSEATGFNRRSTKTNANPDFLIGELALGLAWVGQYPELYDVHLWGAGKPFWQDFSSRFWEQELPDWRKDYPGNRNGHSANICAILHLRSLLGAPKAELIAEMEQQKLLPAPAPISIHFNAPFYAMLIGMEFPIRLESWGDAKPLETVFDEKNRIAEMSFDAKGPAELVFALDETPTLVTLNDRAVDYSQNRVSLPSGKSQVKIYFKRNN